MDRRCDVLMRLHQQSGCNNVYLSYDTLRKRLSDAVREFGYLLAAHADLQSLGASEYPQGPLSDCGGCWRAGQPSSMVISPAGLCIVTCFHVHAPMSAASQAKSVLVNGDKTPLVCPQGGKRPLHSLFIDLCFKLNHLTRADIHGNVWEVGSKTSPFSRFFIHDDEVLQHLGRTSDLSQAPADSQLVCSDFKADEVDAHSVRPT